jgi:hypothetical protein
MPPKIIYDNEKEELFEEKEAHPEALQKLLQKEVTIAIPHRYAVIVDGSPVFTVQLSEYLELANDGTSNIYVSSLNTCKTHTLIKAALYNGETSLILEDIAELIKIPGMEMLNGLQSLLSSQKFCDTERQRRSPIQIILHSRPQCNEAGGSSSISL